MEVEVAAGFVKESAQEGHIPALPARFSCRTERRELAEEKCTRFWRSSI